MTPGESPGPLSLSRSGADLENDQTQDREQETQIVFKQSMSQVKEPTTLCMCPTKPKIPRPQNAFILYRRWRQQPMSAQYPDESNPQISVRIGQEWTKGLSEEQKEIWRQRAEEEKARHHREYPGYRYQPKRRINSSSVSDIGNIPAGDWLRCENCHRSIKPMLGLPRRVSAKPASPTVPSMAVDRANPSLRKDRQVGPDSQMSQNELQQFHIAQNGAMSPKVDSKRRRLDHGACKSSCGSPRCEQIATTAASPSTITLMTQQAGLRPYTDVRYSKEATLPPIRSPARPPAAFSLTTLSRNEFRQAHHDAVEMNGRTESLVLPPLQIGRQSPSPPERVNASKTFLTKIDTLRNIARPTAVSASHRRGPLIAIEGEDAQTVVELGIWLRRKLRMEDALNVKVIESPKFTISNDRPAMMAQYHCLVASWLRNSDDINSSLMYPSTSHNTAGREDEAEYRRMPVALVANYSLYATDFFCKHFPLAPEDIYKPYDHWMWAASQWRGVCSPDLMIYVRDSRRRSGNHATAAVDISLRSNLFVVDLALANGEEIGPGMDTPVLRRLQFEVREWLRAFEAESGS
jgi:HMG box factor